MLMDRDKEILKHAKEIEAEIDYEEEERRKSGPLKWILGIFLLLIVVGWLIPSYGIKENPTPGEIPGVEDVLVGEVVLSNDTIKVVAREDYLKLLNPRDVVVKRAADRIVNIACGSKGVVCNAKAMFLFVRDNFNYIPDPYAFEYVKSARESLVLGGFDCEDGSILVANLLEAVGIRTRFVLIPKHMYVQAYLPDAPRTYKTEDDWISIDVTCKNCDFGELPYQNVKKARTYI